MDGGRGSRGRVSGTSSPGSLRVAEERRYSRDRAVMYCVLQRVLSLSYFGVDLDGALHCIALRISASIARLSVSLISDL